MTHCRNLRSSAHRVQKQSEVRALSRKNTRSSTSKRQTRSTRSRHSEASIDLNLLEAELAIRIENRHRADNTSLEVEKYDTDSDADSDFTGNDHSDSDSDELNDMLFENVEGQPADGASRNASYDSRCDPGNEDYELDDFVVADESDQESEVDTEAENKDTAKVDIDLRKRKLIRKLTPRKRSSTPSTSSKLFCSGTEDGQFSQRRPSLVICPTDSSSSPAGIFISDDPEEIVEQIMDALALYSRRCNRKRPPTTLILSPSALMDPDVRGGLEDAIRLGLGHILTASDEGEVWLIGPYAS
jgi:hypothetical protein